MDRFKRVLFVLAKFGVVAAALIAIRYYGGEGALFPSVPLQTNQIYWTQLLSTFGPVAFVVERVVELFIVDEDNVEKETLKRKVNARRVDLEQVKTAVSPPGSPPALKVPEPVQLQQKVQDDHTKYLKLSHKRQNHVSLWAYGISVIVALSGVRILTGLFDTTKLVGLQKDIFTYTDIVLTAAVIAGGADGVHQLVRALGSFSSKLKDMATPKPPQ